MLTDNRAPDNTGELPHFRPGAYLAVLHNRQGMQKHSFVDVHGAISSLCHKARSRPASSMRSLALGKRNGAARKFSGRKSPTRLMSSFCAFLCDVTKNHGIPLATKFSK